MNTRRNNKSKEIKDSLDITDEVISSFVTEKKPTKKNRTLPLNEDAYELFEANCKLIGSIPSKVIDKFIESFNQRITSPTKK